MQLHQIHEKIYFYYRYFSTDTMKHLCQHSASVLADNAVFVCLYSACKLGYVKL